MGNLILGNALKYSFQSLIFLGPIYATISALLLYTPKEKYWMNIENNRQNIQFLIKLNEEKPINKIRLERPKNK
jgi:hypothetical protein